MSHTDALSRLPFPDTHVSLLTPGDLILLITHLTDSYLTVTQMNAWTLSYRIRKLVEQG